MPIRTVRLESQMIGRRKINVDHVSTKRLFYNRIIPSFIEKQGKCKANGTGVLMGWSSMCKTSTLWKI